MVVRRGPDRRGRLRHAGYTVVTYQVCWLSRGVVAAATGRAGLRLARQVWSGTWRARLGTVLLNLVLRPRTITVACTDDLPPAALAASGLGAPRAVGKFCLAVDLRDERRRAAFLVGAERRGAPAVVKVSRHPTREDRAGREQRVLSLLPDDGVTPRPLGSGRLGDLEWSAETVLPGRPMREVFSTPRAPVLPVLERLAGWLGALAVSTARTGDWASRAQGDQAIALRGRAEALRALLPDLGGIPAVLVHGDLASGYNVLVDSSGQPAVLDWETTREQSLPLLDLLPLLFCSLARSRAGRGAERQAAYILDVARGGSADSDWLFARVAAYASRLDLPADAVGSLALLAWGHQASMRLVRDELLHEAGLPVLRWTSVGELVLDAWWQEWGAGWAGPLQHFR
jgi:hypothetical protein